jgi:hypothetical protein
MTSRLTKAQIAERDEARERLRAMFAEIERPVVHTVLRSVSRSGMSRDISLLVANGGELVDITYYAAKATGHRLIDKGRRAIRVHGCGMDMGFSLVYDLSHTLFSPAERAGYVISHRWA